MICVYFDLIEVLLKQKANELELGHQQLIVLLVYGQSYDGCHDLLVPCEIAILVFFLVFDFGDFDNPLEKSEQDFT